MDSFIQIFSGLEIQNEEQLETEKQNSLIQREMFEAEISEYSQALQEEQNAIQALRHIKEKNITEQNDLAMK